MKVEVIDIARFEKRSDFYDAIELTLTVKSFDLQAIRARYLQALSNKSGKGGSVHRREVSEGGITRVKIFEGRLVHEEVLFTCKEPRGIAQQGAMWAYSSENTIYVKGTVEIQLTHPWFAYIHTVDFSNDGKRMLVSSSGFDLILEFDLQTQQVVWEWCAWEHGFNKGFDEKSGKEITLSRKPIETRGPILVISDPKNQVLPTAMRAAFINSVKYHSASEDKILATLFHEGKVIAIDKVSKEWEAVLVDMKSPHGGEAIAGGYMATSTGTGEVLEKRGDALTAYSMRNLTGKPEILRDKEWLQNTKRVGENYLVFDSNRTGFIVFSPVRKYYDFVPYNADWAVQDGIIH